MICAPDGRRKSRRCHINLLKPYPGRSAEVLVTAASRVVGETEVEDMVPGDPMCARLLNSAIMEKLNEPLCDLSSEQQRDVRTLINGFPKEFQDTPGLMALAVRDVETGEQHPYRLSPSKLSMVKQELA